MSVVATENVRAVHHDPEAARLALQELDRQERLRHEKATARHAWTYAAGRMVLATVFIISAVLKIVNFAATKDALLDMGTPDPGLLLWLAIIIELGAGALIAAGYKAREVSFGLIAYLAVVTFVMHNDLSQSFNRAFAIANLGLAGGLLMIAGHGSGGVSVDKKVTAKSAA